MFLYYSCFIISSINSIYIFSDHYQLGATTHSIVCLTPLFRNPQLLVNYVGHHLHQFSSHYWKEDSTPNLTSHHLSEAPTSYNSPGPHFKMFQTRPQIKDQYSCITIVHILSKLIFTCTPAQQKTFYQHMPDSQQYINRVITPINSTLS